MQYASVLKSALALGGLTLAMSASAAPVTFSFSGLVTANNPSILIPGTTPTPIIGSTFNGGFTIDESNTSGVGSNCVAISSCWSDVATSWNWDGLNVQFGGPGSEFRVFFSIVDSVAGSGQDELTITLKGDIALLGVLSFTDSSGSAFESANGLLPSFGSFDSATYSYQPSCFGGIGCFFSRRHSGDITALSSPAVVPVPAAAYLFATALGSLLISNRARRRKILPSE